MNLLISLLAAILLIAVESDFIRKYANLYYIVSTILSIGLIVGSFS